MADGRAGTSGPAPTGRSSLELPADKRLTGQMLIDVRWGDMDALGHVNNTVYFRYFESARIAWLESIDAISYADGTGPLVVNAFCNFRRQIEYPARLVARHYVANPGRSSFDAYVTLEREDAPGIICADGGSRTVWVDLQAGRSVPLPERVRAAIVGG